MHILGIQPDAKFLFTKLTRLNIEVSEYFENNIEGIVKNFEECFQAQLEFVEVRLSFRKLRLFIIEPGVLSRIIKLDMHSVYPDEFEEIDLFENMLLITKEDKEDLVSSVWPKLAELNVSSSCIDSYDQGENKITKLEKNLLRRAPNLVKLNLSNTNLTRLSREALFYLQKLRVLRLSRVIIDSFEVFDCLVDLEELEVEIDCELLSRRVKKLALFPKLTKLELKLCNVEWISPDAFDHLTNINSFMFDFGFNMDNTIETGLVPCSIRVSQDLKLLKLNSKNVSRIEKIQFDELRSSSSNIESDLPLTGLKTLKICPASELSFLQMTNLESLSLTLNGNISFLDNGRLACLHSLKTLELHGQSIRTSFACLNGELFSGLTSLEKLSIKHFKTFTLIEPGAFKHLTNLIELNLDYNSIETIEPGAFAHLSKLKILSMSFNKLTQFPSYCFHELPNLAELKLDYNTIETVPSSFSFLNNERVATTSMSSLRLLKLDGNALTALPRNAFSSFPALVYLSLNNCPIRYVENGALDGGLVNLRFLSLANNIFPSFDMSVFDSAEMVNLIYLVLESSSLKSVTTSSVTEPDTFLAKCLNKVIVRVKDNHVQDNHLLLDRLSKEGTIELIKT
jgi:Leucine-rich repeat (LRR) protein